MIINLKDAKGKLYFLKLDITGHPLFEDGLEFSLVNDSRVNQNNSDSLTHLISSMWVNNLATIVGKNATGKTSIMKLIIGILQILVANNQIINSELNNILMGSKPININAYFYGTDNYVYKDSISFETDKQIRNSWHISSESIFRKKVSDTMSKKKIFDFKNITPTIDRTNLEGVAASILSDQASIFRAIISKYSYIPQVPIDTLFFTDFNAISYGYENIPTEILNFLDPTIEYLKIETDENDQLPEKNIFRLKFRNRDKEIVENSFSDISKYLSSGTAKGVTLYGSVLTALTIGGILFIDELENHFNHAIVDSFVEYFTDPKINVNRATLVFSTHYTEILNSIDRTDEEYITKRNQKISLQRYSQTDVRSDLNKAEVFDSDYLGGTAPEYDAYIALKKATKGAIKKYGK